MPVLANPKYERFSQELAQGKSADKAYCLAGFVKNRSNASRLSSNEDIRARVQEIQLGGAQAAGLTVQWVIDGIKENFARAMQHVEVKDHRGQGIGEYRYDGAVANKCLELAGKHLGLFAEKVEHSGSLTISHEEALKELE